MPRGKKRTTTNLTYSETFARVKAVLESWFRKMNDVPFEPQGKMLLECAMELGEAMYPNFRQQMKDAIDGEQANRKQGGTKDWRTTWQ